jgi:Mor family transcriptional regulator
MRTAVSSPSCLVSCSPEWLRLTESQQTEVARRAMQIAIVTLADQAEVLAREMEEGCLLDRGGPDALRLLSKVMRISGQETAAPVPDLATMEVTGRA